jgi:hypothetical protein
VECHDAKEISAGYVSGVDWRRGVFAVGRSKRWDMETNALGTRLLVRVRVGEEREGL